MTSIGLRKTSLNPENGVIDFGYLGAKTSQMLQKQIIGRMKGYTMSVR